MAPPPSHCSFHCTLIDSSVDIKFIQKWWWRAGKSWFGVNDVSYLSCKYFDGDVIFIRIWIEWSHLHARGEDNIFCFELLATITRERQWFRVKDDKRWHGFNTDPSQAFSAYSHVMFVWQGHVVSSPEYRVGDFLPVFVVRTFAQMTIVK